MDEIRIVEERINEIDNVLASVTITDAERMDNLGIYREELDKLEDKVKKIVEENIEKCQELTRRDNDNDEINVRMDLEELTKNVVRLDGINKRINDKNSRYNVWADGNRIVDERLKYSLKELRSRLVTIKKVHIMKCNSMIRNINKKIAELKGKNITSEDILQDIDKLNLLEENDRSIIRYNQYRYLSEINVEEINETLENIKKIENRLNNKIDVSIEEDKLEEELTRLEDDFHILFQEYENIATNMDRKIINLDEFKNKVMNFSKLGLVNLKMRLINAKGSINEGKLIDLTNRFKELDEKIKVLELSKLYEVKKSIDSKKKDLEREIEDISIRVTDMINNNITRFGDSEISSEMANLFDKELNEFIIKIEELEDKINDFEYKEGNEKQSLIDKIKEIKDKISKTKEDYRLNIIQEEINMNVLDNLEKLEKAVLDLGEVLDKCDTPINKEDRKKINKIFNGIERDIRHLEKEVVHYKSSDVEFFEDKIQRLNNLKEKMDVLRVTYSNKCPLKIKAYKSATNFYKKYKKVPLVVAGLSSLAITMRSLLTIPLIAANEIMASALGKGGIVFKKINKILIYLSGVKEQDGVLVMANGMKIDSSSVTSSLLKSVMTDGVELKTVLPVIDSIKKVSAKIKLKEMKEKLNAKKIDKLNKRKEEIEKEIERRSMGGRR